MQGEIARISVIWAERTGQGTRFRIYDVLPDEEKIIRAERMEELVDDLSLICQQLVDARAATARRDRRDDLVDRVGGEQPGGEIEELPDIGLGEQVRTIRRRNAWRVGNWLSLPTRQ